MATDTGWVSVGTNHDTAAFAVASPLNIRKPQGQDDSTNADRSRHQILDILAMMPR